jgi:hypothetical protein
MRRSLLVLIAGTLALTAAIALVVVGVSFLNIDHLKAHPLSFILLFIGAPAAILLSLVLATVSRLVQINIIIFITLWLCAEIIFGLLDRRIPQIHGDPVGINQEYYIRDPVIGYRPAPGSIARHTEFLGDRQVYSVTYTIDRFGRRDTPVERPSSRPGFLLFFGDSNTFGEGMRQTETLPYWAGRLAPGYWPYNYAFSGWGPAQMLDLLRTRDLNAQVYQAEGYAVFFFIEEHIARVIGSSQVSGGWGYDFSHYTMNANGDLIREGSFATGRPFTTLFYEFVDSSNIARYFNWVLPRNYSEKDYRLTATVIKESENLLRSRFRLQGFYVVIAPAFDERQVQIYLRFMAALRKVGIRYLDLTHLYDTKDVCYRVAEADYHNSALANRLIAAKIVRDLGIGTSDPRERAVASPAE